jgi:hypothetical protein
LYELTQDPINVYDVAYAIVPKYFVHGCFKYFSEELEQLISEASNKNVKFVYAISPGLDITYSSEQDINALHEKIQQVQGHH